MSFNRIIYQDLMSWKNRPGRKPLILRGARQVGKTTIVRSFSNEFKHYIALNLEKTKHKSFFEDNDSIETIVEAIFFENKIPTKDINETLLFIDEIQESEKAIKYLRYFYEEYPDFKVISAGSLLEFTLKKIQSMPVGRVEFLYLHPVNFKEYLEATNNKEALELLNDIPIKKFAHKKLLELFHRYLIIGGMPEIIKKEIENSQLIDLQRVYESIIETYKNDIEKYTFSESDRRIIKHIMNTAHLSVDKRIKFQNFGNSNYKSREISEQLRNLEDARIMSLLYPTTITKVPITPDSKKSPKLQYLDTGLLNYNLKIQSELLQLTDYSDAFRGALIPHIINQEIISINNKTNDKLNFWVREKKQSSAEVDLVLKHGSLLMPIEIKSGTYGKLRSLHQFIDVSEHKYAIRFYGGEFKVQNAKTQSGTKFLLLNLPFYLGTNIYEYMNWFTENY